jgi:hypothetical protein
MNDSYLETGEGVNPRPAYYAVIPVTVLRCKTLPPAAKLLYGDITALCSVEGYCWASNAYFEELYGVDRSTVKRWLAALVEAKFILVVVPLGTGNRRIYLASAHEVPPAQKQAGGSAKMREGGRKNAPPSITENNTLSIQTLNVADVAAPQEQKGSASPPPLTSYKASMVDAVVAATGDTKSVLRFRQLLDVADDAGCIKLWGDALDALNFAQRSSTGIVERPGAYFCSVLCKSLSDCGVVVPVGSARDRRSVRSQVAASFAAADAKGGQA